MGNVTHGREGVKSTTTGPLQPHSAFDILFLQMVGPEPHPRQTLKAGGLRGPPPVLSWGLRLTGGGGASALLCLETDALAFLPLQPMSQKHLIHSFTHQRK